MIFDIITPFPELVEPFSSTGLIGRSFKSGIMNIRFHNPRDFSFDKRKNIDDYPYGGGCGMVLAVEPIKRCIENILLGPDAPMVPEENVKIILTSPQGKPFDQNMARKFSQSSRLIIVCGHYEGIDERVADTLCTDEVSMGDFVMTGGEIAAMAIIDTVARLIPGVVGKCGSVENDSFYNESVFDHPHFTRPFEWQGYKVPQVLANGNHAHINLFRHRCALSKTARIRPDLVSWNRVKTEFEDEKVKKARIRRLNKLGLIKKYDFNKDAPDNKNIDNKDAADNKNIDKKCGNKNSHEKNKPEKIEFTSRNLFLGLVHCPVLNKFKGVSTSSVTNFDIHDISRSARTFGVKNYFLIIPQKNQRDLVEKIRDFWLDPDKKIPHKKRCEALERIEVLPNLNSVIQEIFHLTGKKPLIAVTSASESEGIDILDYNMAVEKSIVSERPLLILLGTAYGLAPEIIRLADFSLPPVMGFDQWNHLSVRAAGAIILSRLNEAYNHRTYNQRIYNQRTYNQRTCNQGI